MTEKTAALSRVFRPIYWSLAFFGPRMSVSTEAAYALFGSNEEPIVPNEVEVEKTRKSAKDWHSPIEVIELPAPLLQGIWVQEVD